MASGKKRNRRGGHPAKQAARRERDRARGEAPADSLRRAAATICREAATLEDALDAELWASGLLGSWWPPSHVMSIGDSDVALGGPLVSEVARLRLPGAAAALLALGAVSESELGVLALDHANQLLVSDAPRPRWGQAIMEATVLRTAVMREDVFDDGVTIFIEATHEDGEPHAIGVYIDHNLGGMATDVVLADSIDRVDELLAEHLDDHPGLQIEPIDSGEAYVRISDAMELTDMTLEPPVSDDYAGLRALARLRADDLSGPFPDRSPPEVGPDERDNLLSNFLGSPEGKPFAADGDEAFVVTVAIDFCADYVDGRPLRWSPALVPLFMVDWMPRKVLADRTDVRSCADRPRSLGALRRARPSHPRLGDRSDDRGDPRVDRRDARPARRRSERPSGHRLPRRRPGRRGRSHRRTSTGDVRRRVERAKHRPIASPDVRCADVFAAGAGDRM